MKAKKVTLEQEQKIKDFLSYNDTTGEFHWKKSPARPVKAGAKAGNLDQHGYVKIHVCGRLLGAHRIAYFITHGFWPDYVDHINGDRADNRIKNLRSCTKRQNNANRHRCNTSTGEINISKRKEHRFRLKPYVIHMHRKGKNYTKGYFANLEEAIVVRNKMREDFDNEFSPFKKDCG